MKKFQDKRRDPKRILFVWDGTRRHVETADDLAESFEDVCVYAVRALPHESIHAYSTSGLAQLEPSKLEREMRADFRKATRQSRHLATAKFEIVFGERITEILELAATIKASAILIPRFQQSSFSKWIHGDLNERIKTKSPCPVVLLDAATHRDHEDADSQPPSTNRF